MKLPALLCVALVSACSSAANHEPVADIAKVADLKSSFGPEFKVTEVPVTGIDPKMLAAQKMPEGMTFAPADCAKFAAGQTMPTDVKGNMAGLSAEGDGNRFVVIAMETSAPIPLIEPGRNCVKVSFSGGAVRGTVEVVPAPPIVDVVTLGVHRILQATINNVPETGQIYSYRAQFGDYQVIVTANPLVDPDKPVASVDSKRAVDLLTAAVTAIKKSG
jgi:hypothetical protein